MSEESVEKLAVLARQAMCGFFKLGAVEEGKSMLNALRELGLIQ